jgi:uncharacterized membrane protein
MVIMALDHTRDMLYLNAQDPMNMATTTPALFFTRWITHLCAPSFVFLAGVSAYIVLKNGQDPRALRRFLLSRGIWLVILEFSLVNFGLFFDVRFRQFLFEVIATIGVGFIALSFLSRLSTPTLLITGLVLVFGHELISMAPMPSNSVLQVTGSLLFGPGAFPLSATRLFVVAYPIIPWLGIMLTGYAAGRLFDRPAADRKKIFRRIGLAALGLFLLLRGANLYGDPSHWAVQKNTVYTVLSFLEVSKYPPSLLFSLCMLGILLLALSVIEGTDNRLTRVLIVYGRAPLFYFIVHLYVIHTIMLIVLLLQGYHFSDMIFVSLKLGRPEGRSGLSLPWIYLLWVGVVLLLFPLCRWYGRYKAAHREKKWLRYL